MALSFTSEGRKTELAVILSVIALLLTS